MDMEVLPPLQKNYHTIEKETIARGSKSSVRTNQVQSLFDLNILTPINFNQKLEKQYEMANSQKHGPARKPVNPSVSSLPPITRGIQQTQKDQSYANLLSQSRMESHYFSKLHRRVDHSLMNNPYSQSYNSERNLPERKPYSLGSQLENIIENNNELAYNTFLKTRNVEEIELLDGEMREIVDNFQAAFQGNKNSQELIFLKKMRLKHPIFIQISFNAFRFIIEKSYLIRLKEGETLYRLGQRSNQIYFILCG